MKKHFQKILKGIFLGSVSSLIASHGANAIDYDLDKLKINNDGNIEVNAKKENSQKFILKFQSDDSYLIAGHRSHSSHRSHASHYSHRSSSTYSGSTGSTYSSDYSSPSSTSTRTSSSVVNNIEINNSPTESIDLKSNVIDIINLGDRILKKGMIGTDVYQLKKILIEKEFLIDSLSDERILFDKKIETAVITFQISIGLVADGIVGPKTVYYLKK